MTEEQIEVKRLKEEAYQLTKRYIAQMYRIQKSIEELHEKGAKKRDKPGNDGKSKA